MAFDQVSKMNKVIFGDCRDTMRDLKAQGVRVQCCVTSPPYFWQRDYGHPGQIGLEKTPAEYVAAMVEVFDGVRDLLADDGVLWLNLGDSYNAAGRAGHGTRQGCKQGTNRASATKADNCRPSVDWLKPKDLIGIPWRVAFALQEAGWYLRQDIIWHKPNPMPESVTDRCTKAHEYLFLLTKSERYFFDAEAIKEQAVKGAANSDFHTGKTAEHQLGRASTKPRKSNSANDSAVPGATEHSGLHREGTEREPENRNRRSVWTVPTQPYSGAHFAVFPAALIEPCILAGSRPGNLVLDPFMGSGTTAQVAQQLGRQWIGCELNTEYAPLQQARTAQTALAI
jgi:DNA modification methylase